jgi:hypothetical protein
LHVTPTIIGRLLACSRVYARRRLFAGDFGPVHRRGDVSGVDVGNIAALLGASSFTAHQLAAAGLPVPSDDEGGSA